MIDGSNVAWGVRLFVSKYDDSDDNEQGTTTTTTEAEDTSLYGQLTKQMIEAPVNMTAIKTIGTQSSTSTFTAEDFERFCKTKPNVQVIESEHPYKLGIDQYSEVVVQHSAKLYAVAFSPQTNMEGPWDYITLYSDVARTVRIGSDKYHGDSSQFPSVAESLYTTSNTIVIHFHSIQDRPAAWGYKMAVWPLTDEEAEEFENSPRGKWNKAIEQNGAVVIQSDHPYENNADSITPVNVNLPHNATGCHVAFHSLSSTGNVLQLQL